MKGRVQYCETSFRTGDIIVMTSRTKNLSSLHLKIHEHGKATNMGKDEMGFLLPLTERSLFQLHAILR